MPDDKEAFWGLCEPSQTGKPRFQRAITGPKVVALPHYIYLCPLPAWLMWPLL